MIQFVSTIDYKLITNDTDLSGRYSTIGDKHAPHQLTLIIDGGTGLSQIDASEIMMELSTSLRAFNIAHIGFTNSARYHFVFRFLTSTDAMTAKLVMADINSVG